MFENMTMYQALKEACLDYPKGTAIYYEGNRISFSKFLYLIDKCSDALYNQLGVRSGDVVILSQPNIPNVLILFYALNKIGAICNMIHPFTPFDQLYDIYHNTNCKFAFVFEQRVAKEIDKFKKTSMNIYVTRIEDYLPIYKKVIYHLFMNGKIRHKLARSNGFIGFKYMYKMRNPGRNVPENNNYLKASVYLHSGSTTGDPKTICHNDAAFNFIASHALEFLSCSKEDIMGRGMLSILPSFHGFGLCIGMHSPLVNRFANVLIPKFSIKKVTSAMKHFDVAVLTGVPTMYQSLVESEQFKSLKQLKNLYVAFSGGDSLSPALQSEFDAIMEQKDSKCRLFEGYGLTEVIAVNTVNTFKNNKPNSVGRPCSNVSIKICGDGGNQLKTNEIGEIYISSGSMMLNYFDDNKLTRSTISKGWLKTGDIGYLDKDNYIYITGRCKNVIIFAWIH